MNNNWTLGKLGESAAVAYLERKGHQIVVCNFRFERKEVDIISLDKNILVFTEVKTRANYDFGFPEEAIGLKKQEHIKTVALSFLSNNPIYDQMRFDMISIIINNRKVVEIVHFEDAFY